MSSPPAWSIGTSKRDVDLKSASNYIPGPGTYNGDAMKHTTPNWRIGTSTRREEKRSHTPGPGAYDPEKNKFKSPPKFSIGIKVASTERNSTPGPGAYEALGVYEKEKKGPSYSMRGRSMDLSNRLLESPGPAAYDQNSTIRTRNSARVRIGTSTRDQFYKTHFTPGPGSYQANKTEGTFETMNAPKWGFGTSERKTLNTTLNDLPGPGAYTMNTSFDEHSKGGVILARRPDSALLIAARIPGPGTYDASILGKRAPTFRMGSARRSSLIEVSKEVPGPGNYEPKVPAKNCNTKIGSSVRRPLNESTAAPGPGSYNVDLSTNQGPRYGMVPRRKDIKDITQDKTQPGPGAYEISMSATKTTYPKFGIGSATRDQFYKSGALPGPGSYETRGKVAGGPQWRFGSAGRSRSMNLNDEPGPGAYNLPPKFADVPKYSMTGVRIA